MFPNLRVCACCVVESAYWESAYICTCTWALGAWHLCMHAVACRCTSTDPCVHTTNLSWGSARLGRQEGRPAGSAFPPVPSASPAALRWSAAPVRHWWCGRSLAHPAFATEPSSRQGHFGRQAPRPRRRRRIPRLTDAPPARARILSCCWWGHPPHCRQEHAPSHGRRSSKASSPFSVAMGLPCSALRGYIGLSYYLFVRAS